MRITSGGNVLIGTTTDASNRLEVQGIANNWAISATANSTASGSFGMIVRGGTNSNDIAFRVNNQANSSTFFNVRGDGISRSLRFQVGAAGIGAGNYCELGNDDNVGYIDTVRAVNSGDFHFRFDGTSRATINRSTGVYVATSDINKKKDIEESKIGLSEVMQLKPTLYRMKTDNTKGEKELGFIAQEVKGIIPSAYQESGDFIGLNFNPIVAALTKAVQELKAELDTATTRLQLLENK
jgi:hypothetical protein